MKRYSKDGANKLPLTFRAKFWREADQRSLAVKEVKRRLVQLRGDTGADSIQKDLLCQRVAFVVLQLETMECLAVEQVEGFDPGKYIQAVNCLTGLLKALGLEKQISKVHDLKAYVQEKQQ